MGTNEFQVFAHQKLWKWIKGTVWKEIAPPHARCHTAKSTIPMPCLNFLFLGHFTSIFKNKS